MKPPPPVLATTVDSSSDTDGYDSPLLLPELPYTTTAKADPYFHDPESPIVPQPRPLPSERPPLQRSPSSNLMTRWNRVDVRDSVLIAELGELRMSVELANGNLQPDDDHGLVSEPWCDCCIYRSHRSSSEDDDQRWRRAQKSAFCRRELIKTELTYLEGILQLENKNVGRFITDFRSICSLLIVPIAATPTPPGSPSVINRRFLPVTRSFPL